MATKREVEAALTPEAIARAKQYLAEPQVMKRLVELVGELLMKQEINGIPLAHFLSGRYVESSEAIHHALANDDFLQEIAPLWLKICHWAAWDRALRKIDIQQFPSDDILNIVRPLAVTIADDPQHKAVCLERLAAVAARAEPRLDIETHEIPQAFLRAFQEKENQDS
jgi:hypothetical protein